MENENILIKKNLEGYIEGKFYINRIDNEILSECFELSKKYGLKDGHTLMLCINSLIDLNKEKDGIAEKLLESISKLGNTLNNPEEKKEKK